MRSLPSVGSVVDVSVVSVDSAVWVDSVVSADTGRGSTTRPTDVPVSPRASAVSYTHLTLPTTPYV